MDYNKLRTFTVVAETGSVTRAAAILHRTQSAISQQLAALESDLGFGVLDRSGGRVYLTPEGEALNERASESLAAIDRELARIRREVHAEEGRLRVGAAIEYANHLLVPKLGPFRARHPKVDIDVRIGTSEEIEDNLIANRLDVGVLVSFSQKELFETRTCAREVCGVIASPRYLDQQGALDRYRAIAEADIFDFTEDFACMSVWLAKNAPRLGPVLKRRRPAVVLPDHHGIKNLVCAGAGIAVLPLSLVERELKKGQLVRLMPGAKPIAVTVDLAVRRGRQDRRLHRLFLEHFAAS